MAEYRSRSPESKALKWLRRLSENMIFYEGVVDTVIQQHPESVSLIWGTMKFLFLVRVPASHHSVAEVEITKTQRRHGRLRRCTGA